MLFVMPDLKKFAKEKGLTISKTFVYGEYDGYMLCIAEGYGIKVLSISCKINDNKNVISYVRNILSLIPLPRDVTFDSLTYFCLGPSNIVDLKLENIKNKD